MLRQLATPPPPPHTHSHTRACTHAHARPGTRIDLGMHHATRPPPTHTHMHGPDPNPCRASDGAFGGYVEELARAATPPHAPTSPLHTPEGELRRLKAFMRAAGLARCGAPAKLQDARRQQGQQGLCGSVDPWIWGGVVRGMATGLHHCSGG